MRRLIVLATAAAALTLPVAAFGGGAGATSGGDVWTNQPTNHFGQDACTGQWETGIGTESGSDRWVATRPDGFHITGQVSGTVPFYVARNLDPNDPQPGAYIGTYVYTGTFDEQDPGPAPGATSGTTQGVMTYADGSMRRINGNFHLTFGTNGWKVFFFNSVCSG